MDSINEGALDSQQVFVLFLLMSEPVSKDNKSITKSVYNCLTHIVLHKRVVNIYISYRLCSRFFHVKILVLFSDDLYSVL